MTCSTQDLHGRLLEGLRAYSTLAELRESAFFEESRARLEAILSTPDVRACAAAPRLHSFVRVVQWNIEKGKRWREVVDRITSDERLKWADVLLLNEADYGMARSGNIHTAFEIASALGMSVAFGPAHIELTKGTGDERDLPGENRESLQGNAVLSRHPIAEARIVPLPSCFEPFEFHEKRYGGRNCVWAKLILGGRGLWVGATHLEVRATPACRARQMKHILARLPGSMEDAWLIGGDLNASGFPRGTRWRALRSIERLLLHDMDEVKDDLRHPERRSEPLFDLARRAGFGWEDLNSGEETASTPIGGLEESDVLPKSVVRYVRRRLAPYRGYLSFKLDWFLGRGVRGLRAGEVIDEAAGVASAVPACIPTERTGPGRISDHAPIVVDLSLPN